MFDLTEVILMTGFYRPDPINDPIRHQAKVDEAREQLGDRYLCHPANHVKPIRRGQPCNQQQ